MKPTVCYISGVDQSGKTSLVLPLRESRGNIDLIYDRGPLDNIAYSWIYSRGIPYESFYGLTPDTVRTFHILLTATPEEIERRAIASSHRVFDYAAHLKAFDIAFKKFKDLHRKAHFHRMDTTFVSQSNLIQIVGNLLSCEF